MSGPIRKDSMSSYETPSMCYDTARRPAKIQPSKAPQEPSLGKDTIETAQQRLNREMLERFQDNSRAPRHVFMIVSQAGKYLFLVVMFPTYVCFYKIPHWLFVDLLPQALRSLKAQYLRLGRLLSEGKKKITDVMQSIANQMIGDAVSYFKKRSSAVFNRGLAKLSFVKEKIAQKLFFLKERAVKAVSKLLNAYQFFNRETHVRMEKMEAAKEYVLEKVKKGAETVLFPLDQADRYVIQPIWQRSAQFAAFLSTIAKKAAKNAIEQIQKVMRPPLSRIQSTGKALYNFAERTAEYAAEQTKNHVLPYIEILRRARERVSQAIEKNVSKATSITKRKFQEVIYPIFESLPMPFPIHVLAPFGGWMRSQGSSFFKKGKHNLQQGSSKAKAFFKSTGVALKHAIQKSKQLLQQAVHFFLKGLCWLWKQARVILYWSYKHAVILSLRAFRLLMQALKIALHITYGCTYGLRLFIAWTWVISICGMILVRKLSQEMIAFKK